MHASTTFAACTSVMPTMSTCQHYSSLQDSHCKFQRISQPLLFSGMFRRSPLSYVQFRSSNPTSKTQHPFQLSPKLTSSIMEPLSTKGNNKRALPTSPTSQPPSQNDSKRSKASPTDNNNEITGVRQTTAGQMGPFRNHLMSGDRLPFGVLNRRKINDVALAIEEHAAENTAQIIESFRFNQPQNRHHHRLQRKERNHANVHRRVTEGSPTKQQRDTREKGCTRFVLAEEDSEFVCAILRRITPRGVSPPTKKSIKDLMESGNDEEHAKQFLDELEINVRKRSTPKVRCRATPSKITTQTNTLCCSLKAFSACFETLSSATFLD